MLSPFKTEGKPAVAVRATVDQEIFMKDRLSPGRHWHTVEGAFYFYESGKHFLTYSGNCYENPDYYVGYAVADGVGSDLRKLKFKKYPAENVYLPFLAKNGTEEGTGHNSVIKVDGQYYIVYHARDYNADKQTDCRTARIRKFKVDGCKLILE
jgi:GH43 family beta-xylosidase